MPPSRADDARRCCSSTRTRSRSTRSSSRPTTSYPACRSAAATGDRAARSRVDPAAGRRRGARPRCRRAGARRRRCAPDRGEPGLPAGGSDDDRDRRRRQRRPRAGRRPGVEKLEAGRSPNCRRRSRRWCRAGCSSGSRWTSTPTSTALGDFLVRGVVGADAERGGAGGRRRRRRSARPCSSRCGTPRAPTSDLRGHAARGAGRAWPGRCCSPAPAVARRCSAVPTTTCSLCATALSPPASPGFFAAGEIGPVAGRSHLHGFTASVLAFLDGPAT